MPKVSVIVPVFNSEEFIASLARSLFSQTLEDLEIIFVDDCATDRSFQIISALLEKEFPQRKNQVKILRNETNIGSGLSRKLGFDISTGKYVSFCDSDDTLESDMFELMYNAATDAGADAVICDYTEETTESYFVWKDHFKHGQGKISGETLLREAISVKSMQSLWRYLFSRDLFNNDIEFPVQRHYGNDIALVVQLLYYASVCSYVGKPLYHWQNTKMSFYKAFSEAAIAKRCTGRMESTRLIVDFLKRNKADQKYRKELVALKFYTLSYFPSKTYKDLVKWSEVYPEIKGHVLFNSSISIAGKKYYASKRIRLMLHI